MANPWIGRRVLSYAHQGGALEAPSSTLYAMDLAVRNGAQALEIDLHPSSDGHLVCVHDETLDRTTDLQGYVHDYPLELLRRGDAAFYFVPESGEVSVHDAEVGQYLFRGRAREDGDFAIPEIGVVMARYPGVFLNLDIKEDQGDSGHLEVRLGEIIESSDRIDSVIVASFLQEPLDRFRTRYPEIATSASPEEALTFYQSYLSGERPEEIPFAALQIPASYGGIEYLDSKLVDFAHECGVAVHVWTINDEAQMERLVQLGVDGVISDRPSVLHRVLERNGVDYRGAPKERSEQ